MEGLERIKILAADIKDTALLKIINYLLSRKDMNEKYLNEEKSLKQMVTYIKSQAQKEAKDGMAMIEDEVVYGWAIHYFDESNEKLKIITKSLNQVPVEKNQTESTKENESIKIDKPSRKPKGWVPEGQLSLFD